MSLLAETGSRIPALIFGGGLIMGGIVMLTAQRKAQRELESSTVSDRERKFLSSRIRRRTQVAGMILLMGVMIPLGDYSPELWVGAVATFAIYWIIVLGLAFWTILLAIGDLIATQTHASVELSDLERKQMQLEYAAKVLREREQDQSEK